ncbi:MAG: ABC transporter permease [Gammaproteobacteria bacterium]|nr:ABC transporter permease [Gammaproteobacteria bacterium]
MLNRLYSVWLIAQRDWVEATSTKMFWLGALLMPVVTLILAIFAMFAVTVASTSVTVGSYYVIDRSEGIGLDIRNEILRTDLSTFVRAVSERKPNSDDEAILTEIHEATQTTAMPDLIESFLEFLEHPQPDLTIASRDTLAERFSIWWQNNKNTIIKLAPSVSFARYEEILTPNLSEQELISRLKAGKILGYFIIPEGFVNSNENAKFITETILKQDLANWYENFATRVIQNKKFAESNISRETALWLLQRASFQTSKAVEPARDSGTTTSSTSGDTEDATKEVTVWETVGEFAPAVYQYILWFLVFIGATILMTNTVEEKSTKLVEVLLSDLDSVQLMDGKLLGSALTLLTVVGLWIFLISLPILLGSKIVVAFFPQIGEFLQSGALSSIFNPLFVINFVIFFVLGFAFYGYSLSALGSVCSNIREAQMMATPINLVAIVPLILMVPIALDKTGTIPTIMSYIPPFTPFVMMNIVAEVAWINYLLILAWMTACTLGVRWLAKKIYTKGILLENKPAGIKGLVRLVGRAN